MGACLSPPPCAVVGVRPSSPPCSGVAVGLVSDARAQPTGDGIRPGRSLLVFHDIDFVAAVGYRTGDPMRIDVFRGDHRIGGTAGRAAEHA